MMSPRTKFGLVENQVADFAYLKDGSARLHLTKPDRIIAARLEPHGGEARALEVTAEGDITIPFPELDPLYEDEIEKHHDLIIEYADGDVSFLELRRQNPVSLKRHLNIESQNGYTIAGRNNFLDRKPIAKTVVYVDKARAEGIDTRAFKHTIFPSPELNKAAEILSWIFDGRVHIGPRENLTYASVSEQMQAVREGRDSLQCGDLCTVWAEIACHQQLSFRMVGLYSYGPQVADLVAMSHAVVELDTSQGPVILDLWANRLFYGEGRYLSLQDMIDLLRIQRSFVMSHSIAFNPNAEMAYRNSEYTTVNSLYRGIENYEHIYLNWVSIGEVVSD